ncbi:MAG: iron chelate uptake ABC transporter family permease subunit, partial [Burkholderiales bacterium]
MSRPLALAIVFVVAALASVFVALVSGPFPISTRLVLDSVLFPVPGVVHDIIWQLRAPRALAAFACGGLLALAGALLQALLRNALADPYVLGVSGGAALGALLALVAGAGIAFLHAGALLGAACAIAIVFGLSFRTGEWDIYRLLLTGVVLAAGFSALVSLTLVTAPQVQVKGMLFWLMGDLSYADGSLASWLVLIVGTALTASGARGLDLLALGDTKA